MTEDPPRPAHVDFSAEGFAAMQWMRASCAGFRSANSESVKKFPLSEKGAKAARTRKMSRAGQSL